MQHIGIAGCSAEGAALCYRTICTEAARQTGTHAHPEITLHTPSLAEYVTRIEAGDWTGVGELMLASAHKLAAAGAAFLICPDNTIHQALPLIRDRSPLPWMHIAEIVATTAHSHGYRRVGVMGTRWLVASDVYSSAFAARDIAAIQPSAEDTQLMNAIIMDELVPGIVRRESVHALEGVIDRQRAARCDAVVLGCTELPLVLGDANATLPTLDSTRLLAKAALRRAMT